MQSFGPGHPIHGRVPWKKHLESTTIMFPSKLLPPLTHNDPPTSAEISEIDEFRAYIARCRRSNQEKIRKLQEEISKLKEAETQLQKQSYACDVIMSPIRHLPDDIVYKIVTSDPLLPDIDDYTDPAIHVPSTLAEVCISWRAVVQSVPSLWNRMCFDCAIWNFKPTDTLFDHMNRFGRLSKCLPVSMHLDETVFDDNGYHRRSILHGSDSEAEESPPGEFVFSDRAFSRVVEWLFGNWDFRDRLTELSIHASFPTRLYDALLAVSARQQLSNPPLTSLLIHPGPWDVKIRPKDSRMEIHKLFELLPSLSRFWFSSRSSNCCCFFDATLPPSTPAFQNLKSIYLESKIKLAHFEKSLELLPNLEAAWYSVQVPRRGTIEIDDTVPPLTHHHLKELNFQVPSIYWLDSDPAAFPLATMRFPALETLNLYFPASSIGLKFSQGDYEKAFPALRHLSVQLSWTSRRWPLEELYTHFFSFPDAVSTASSDTEGTELCTAASTAELTKMNWKKPTKTSTSITFSVSVSQPSFGKFATAIDSYCKTVFARPNLLHLTFKFKFDHLWRTEWERRVSNAIVKILKERKPGTTVIEFSIKPNEDGESSDSEQDSSEDSESEELAARVEFVERLRSEIGSEVIGGDVKMFVPPLDVSIREFKAKYFV